MRLASIRLTWPSQRRRLSLRMANMLFMFAHSRTSAFDTLSCHLMRRMRRRHLRWKLLSFFSWLAYVVHASLLYRRVLSTQA